MSSQPDWFGFLIVVGPTASTSNLEDYCSKFPGEPGLLHRLRLVHEVEVYRSTEGIDLYWSDRSLWLIDGRRSTSRHHTRKSDEKITIWVYWESCGIKGLRHTILLQPSAFMKVFWQLGHVRRRARVILSSTYVLKRVSIELSAHLRGAWFISRQRRHDIFPHSGLRHWNTFSPSGRTSQ